MIAMPSIPRNTYIGEQRDYRICCHHIMTPTNRIVYPRGERLMTWQEATDAVAKEQAKGYMVAWIIDRSGLGAEAPKEAEHFYTCKACGAWVDCRDLGMVFDHEPGGSHPKEDQRQ